MPQRTNSVFLGTSVRSGTARVVIVETGVRTEFGGIAGRLARTAPETEFARGLRQFGYLLTRVMVVMVLFVLTINLLGQRPVVDSLLFAVALAVGLSPELLPAIVSITLSSGARRMAHQGVIVRRLEAIENLGGIDVLCTDKTGTLTKGVVKLSAALDPTGSACEKVRRLAHLNAELQTGIDNPLDAAIIGEKRGFPMRRGRDLIRLAPRGAQGQGCGVAAKRESATGFAGKCSSGRSFRISGRAAIRPPACTEQEMPAKAKARAM